MVSDGFWEGRECYFCHSQVEYCCDMCGTLVCENHHITDGWTHYFCSNSCCNEFEELVNKKLFDGCYRQPFSL